MESENCVEKKCFYLPICKIVEVVMRCSVRLFADPWPTGFSGDLRTSGAFSINVLAVNLQIVEFEST